MKDLFEKFVPWKILRYLSFHSTSGVYVQELARKLDLSAGMCSKVLKEFEAEGILRKRDLGKAHYYQLEDIYVTRALKRFVAAHLIHVSGLLDRLKDAFPGALSYALYGSFAKGDYIEKSDLDILVISPVKAKIDLKDIENAVGFEINITAMSLGQWSKLGKKNDPFYREVMSNHLLLDGGELP